MSDAQQHQLWAADPHQYGPGKIHIVDSSATDKTFCGRFLAAVPGKHSPTGKPTCKICLDAAVRRPEMERQRQQYEAKRIEIERQRAAERRQWNDWYQEYLKTPEWQLRRDKVLKRANGVCEGCGISRATQVHHVTYDHVGNEFLWELRAICRGCHERLHEIAK